MAETREAKVPDIGDFDEVPVIEVLVAVGDEVKADQGLITLESDKATMEVPAPFAGVIRDIMVKVGDNLSEGAVVALIEAAEQGSEGQSSDAAPASESASTDVSTAEAGELIEAKVPDIGDYQGVPVIEVLVAVGDTVKADQGLVTLESDKATMEVPSPADGVVESIAVKVGDELAEGSLVATLRGGSSASASKTAAPAPAQERAESTKQSPPPAPPTPQRPPAPLPPAPNSGGKPAHASPGIRRYARELGVDLSQVSGTGRKGRITREDVNAFVKGALSAPRSSTAGSGGGLDLLPWPKVDFSKFGEVESQPLSRIKKISGANLARNWAMIPHVTQQDEADITEMEAFRKQIGSEQKDVKVTPLVFLIKAVVRALQAFPSFNASLDGDNLVLKKYFHVGIAVDTPDGLVVPVIRDCDRKSLLDLARELAEVSGRARDKKLKGEDMQGGCFSISSLGGIGGTGFTPIINAPEVAILGVSRSAMKPVWQGDSFQPRLMLPLSLSYDHRVIDGAAAARFTAYLAQQLGDIRRLLL